MNDLVKLALPTGRIQNNVFKLLADSGIEITGTARSYRPKISLEGFDTKILKTQNIVEMLDLGRRDIGIAGLDWVIELKAEVVELLNTGLDPVKIVAAASDGFPDSSIYKNRKLVIATEYQSITENWVNKRKLNASIIRSFGTTEAFPPEDADCIVDNTSSGATLEASKLRIIEELLDSSTRIFANPRSLDDPSKRSRIEDFVLILKSVLDARDKVMIEINVVKECLESVAIILPCMKTPTISELYEKSGFVVKAAVSKKSLPTLIPQIKERGGTDIVVTTVSNVIP